MDIYKMAQKEKFKVGDLFCLEMLNKEFAFGRCLSEVSIGHMVDIFDFFSTEPKFKPSPVTERLFHPIAIDSWSLLRRRISYREGNWSVLGFDEDFSPNPDEDTFFTYGTGPTRKKVDIFDKAWGISLEESRKYPSYSPLGDEEVLEMIQQYRK